MPARASSAPDTGSSPIFEVLAKTNTSWQNGFSMSWQNVFDVMARFVSTSWQKFVVVMAKLFSTSRHEVEHKFVYLPNGVRASHVMVNRGYDCASEARWEQIKSAAKAADEVVQSTQTSLKRLPASEKKKKPQGSKKEKNQNALGRQWSTLHVWSYRNRFFFL